MEYCRHNLPVIFHNVLGGMEVSISDPFGVFYGSLVANVSCVDRPGGLEKQNVDLLIGDRPVLYAARHDKELTFLQGDILVTKLDQQAASEHQEQLVLGVVFVPDELTFELGELDNLVIELANQCGIPIFRDQIEFFGQVYFFHNSLRNTSQAR